MKKALKFNITASPKLQNKINISIIFNYLRNSSPISRADLSRNLGLSAPAVSRAVEKLIKEGYLIEVEKAVTSSGKRPTLLSINKKKGYVVVIDLGKSNLKIGICDLDGQIIEKTKGFGITDDELIISNVSKELELFLNNFLSKNSITYEKIIAVCVGIPADIDTVSGKIISAPLYEKWKDINFRKELNKKFNVPIFLENDVNLSALGEKYAGCGKDLTDFIFIEISNGIGAGIVIDNHLFRGVNGAAGEIGFNIINEDSLKNSFGNIGNLEILASIGSIKKRVYEKIKTGYKTSLNNFKFESFEEIDPASIFEAAYNNDSLCKEIINNAATLLSIAIINSVLLLNPQVVVIGGDICNMPYLDKLFINPIVLNMKKSLPFNMPEIKLSQLGEDACLIGASFLALDSLLLEEFPYKLE